LLLITFSTFLLNVFSLQGKDASKLAPNWFYASKLAPNWFYASKLALNWF
jgi:hypothetical protein